MYCEVEFIEIILHRNWQKDKKKIESFHSKERRTGWKKNLCQWDRKKKKQDIEA